MSENLQATTSTIVKVTWSDPTGKPAKTDGDTTWDSSNEDIATVEVDDSDSTKALVTALNAIGPVQIQATVDADLGGGIKTHTALINFNVISGEAGAGSIEVQPKK